VCSRCHLERPVSEFVGKASVRTGDVGEFRTCRRCRDQLREVQRAMREAFARDAARKKLPAFVKPPPAKKPSKALRGSQ
jgi:hypothetical protein